MALDPAMKVIIGNEVIIDLTNDDVTESDVASGKIFHKNDGSVATGTNTYDADTSDATAMAAEILSGRTAYKNGQKLTGTMPNRGGQTGAISDADTPVAILQGFHDGSGSVGIDATEKAKLIPGNIKAGIEVLGVTGTYSGEGVNAQSKSVTPSLSAQTVLPDSGYDYLSQVTVAAIPVTITQSATGGKIYQIG